ncbi:MAG: hypothetical protein ACPGJV_12215 [Bacteriovoracaceae bacterium]
MAQTLLINDNQDFNELYSLNLKAYTGTDVIVKKTLQEAVKLLEVLDCISLVITKNLNFEAVKQLTCYLKVKLPDIPIITIGVKEEVSYPTVHQIDDALDIQKLVDLSSEILGIDEETSQYLIFPNYLPVPIESFRYLQSPCCELYLRLKQGNLNFRYLKRVHKGDLLDDAEIEKLLEKGVKNVFIKKEDRHIFTQSYTARFRSLLTNPDLSLKEAFQINKQAYQMVENLLDNGKFSKEDFELAKLSIDSVEQIVSEKDQTLHELLAQLKSPPTSLRFQKVITMSYLFTWATNKVGIKLLDHYTLTLNDLIFASYFHDLYLKTDQEALIRTNDQLENLELKKEDRERIKKHAALVSNALAKSKQLTNPVIESLLRTQHGATTGVGYTDNFSSVLNEIQMFFISCEAFSHAIITSDPPEDGKIDYDKIAKSLPMKFRSPDFWKMISLLI